MKVNIASNILKILLIIFALGVIFWGVYVLPIMAEQQASMYPEIEYAKLPILIVCQVLLGLLLVGIGMIIYLLLIFDHGKTFSQTFIRGLEILSVMCIIAAAGVIFLLYFLKSLGGTGPLIGLIMVGVLFIILIVASVIMLIRSIVKKAMIYKDDYDLTV